MKGGRGGEVREGEGREKDGRGGEGKWRGGRGEEKGRGRSPPGYYGPPGPRGARIVTDHVTERLVAKSSRMGSPNNPPWLKTRSTGAEVDVMQSSFSISGASRMKPDCFISGLYPDCIHSKQ